MIQNHSSNLVYRRKTYSEFASEALRLVRKAMGVGMMILLVSCGEDRPKGLKLVTVQEFPDARDSRAHVSIIDFDEDPPKRVDLIIGESKHGIELIEVGNPTRTALIRRDGKEIRIEMKEGEPSHPTADDAGQGAETGGESGFPSPGTDGNPAAP